MPAVAGVGPIGMEREVGRELPKVLGAIDEDKSRCPDGLDVHT
jgi:hypothetical protein